MPDFLQGLGFGDEQSSLGEPTPENGMVFWQALDNGDLETYQKFVDAGMLEHATSEQTQKIRTSLQNIRDFRATPLYPELLPGKQSAGYKEFLWQKKSAEIKRKAETESHVKQMMTPQKELKLPTPPKQLTGTAAAEETVRHQIGDLEFLRRKGVIDKPGKAVKPPKFRKTVSPAQGRIAVAKEQRVREAEERAKRTETRAQKKLALSLRNETRAIKKQTRDYELKQKRGEELTTKQKIDLRIKLDNIRYSMVQAAIKADPDLKAAGVFEFQETYEARLKANEQEIDAQMRELFPDAFRLLEQKAPGTPPAVEQPTGLEQPTQTQQELALPPGISQEDFDFTLSQHPEITREQLLQQLQGR